MTEFERWLDEEFVRLNTVFEEAYFAAGQEHVPDLGQEQVLHEGAKRLPGIGGDPYRLLGSVGMYLAACARHQVEDEEVLAPAWALATRLGTSLGVAPRYVFAHQSLHGFRTFTSLPDEQVFVRQNGVAVVGYERAAHALRLVADMGVDGPVVEGLLREARRALEDVMTANRVLADTVDRRRFYLVIRPYFRPHRVGGQVYRGVNAGDFAAVNEIDLLLGLCRADDPFYQRVVAEKVPFVPPDHQVRLRRAVVAEPLMGRFLREPRHAGLFLEVCRAHGAAYALHHGRLVKPFLEAQAGEDQDVTASGPPLSVVVAELGHLVDLRTGRARAGAFGAHEELRRLAELA
ncbi:MULTISPECIES: monodechloroaminopyrrolnitrin synthase PrnB family protein [unclassified Saccharothrix]|uniref:monodechloroaminopyrrolnitrin synthase PrnB family protein n=1 Tax=unclassified Saccharothrix TaxID=2593673 RepID=UPI00307D0389